MRLHHPWESIYEAKECLLRKARWGDGIKDLCLAHNWVLGLGMGNGWFITEFAFRKDHFPNGNPFSQNRRRWDTRAVLPMAHKKLGWTFGM